MPRRVSDYNPIDTLPSQEGRNQTEEKKTSDYASRFENLDSFATSKSKGGKNQYQSLDFTFMSPVQTQSAS
jgi:hypothetical protein